MQFVLHTPSGDREVALSLYDVVSVGRGRECDLTVDDHRVSRMHCCLVLIEPGDRVLVRDLGSRNGTIINDRRIVQQAILCAGEELRIGHTRGRLVSDPEVHAPPPPPPWWKGQNTAGPPALPFERRNPVVRSRRSRPPEEPPPQPQAPVPRPPDQPAEKPAEPAARGAPPQQDPRSPKPVSASTSHQPGQQRQKRPRAVPPKKRTRRKKATSEEAKSGDWLEALTQLEREARSANAVADEPRTSQRPVQRPKRDAPVGAIPRRRAGSTWNTLREVFDYLTFVGIAVVVLLTAGFSTLLVPAFVRLAQDSLSVFIPFGYGGKSFGEYELMQIGIAMAVVGAAPVVVLYAVLKQAEEFLVFAGAGLGAGLVFAWLYGAGGIPGVVLYKCGLGLLGLIALALTGLFAWSVAAPVEPPQRLFAAAAAVATLGGSVFLGRSLVQTEIEGLVLDVPMTMPPVDPNLLGAAACAAVAILFYTLFLQEIVGRYGDDPTRSSFLGYFAYHVGASLVSVSLIGLTNAGVVAGWTSGAFGLTALILLLVDHILFVQVIRFARYTIR